MSGSAGPKSTKGTKFDPDFKAKEMIETDETWFQKRFSMEEGDKTVAGATSKASESGGKGQQNPKKKSRVRTRLLV